MPQMFPLEEWYWYDDPAEGEWQECEAYYQWKGNPLYKCILSFGHVGDHSNDPNDVTVYGELVKEWCGACKNFDHRNCEGSISLNAWGDARVCPYPSPICGVRAPSANTTTFGAPITRKNK